MAALLLPCLLCTPHSTSTTTLTSSPAGRRRQSNHRLVSATAARRPVTTVRAEAATRDSSSSGCGGGTDNNNKLSAWTSVRQERWEGDLAVEGNLPAWLNGTYLRNGPGQWEVGDDDHGFRHLFDGYATLVRVSFRAGAATGAHRQIESDAYVSATASGRPVLREFSQCPTNTTSLLDRVGNFIGTLTGAALTDNPNSAVVPLGDGGGHVLCLTETTKSSVLIDSETLDTMSEFRYVVVPEMPLRYSASSLVRSEVAPYYAFDWLPESGSYMHVVCRSTGNTVASVEVPPFMAIHYINAFEEDDDDGGDAKVVVVDCCEHYGDPEIIHTLLLHRLRSRDNDKDMLPNARVGRFRIPLDGSSQFGELKTAVDSEEHGRGMDMCNINPAFLGKKYRYAYACGARRPCNFPNTITKIDLLEKTATMRWHEEGAVPSEPFFVGRPGAIQEDDGVVISIVSGAGGDGYALVLDATTFQELARVRFPYGLPYGFHGCWIPDHHN